jgi:hypothetical protein
MRATRILGGAMFMICLIGFTVLSFDFEYPLWLQLLAALTGATIANKYA